LGTSISIDKTNAPNSLLDETIETEELIPQAMPLKSGFTLQDTTDGRYQRVFAHRTQFGELLHRGAAALKSTDTEDHIDLVMSVLRGVDTYLLDYGVTRDTYAGVAKQYDVAKQLTRLHAKQKAFPRLIWIKRAQSYHALRWLVTLSLPRINIPYVLSSHFASMYQRRSELDDQIM
jgi:proteasome activator subunit 4